MGSDLLKFSHLAGDGGRVLNEDGLSLPALNLPLSCSPVHIASLGLSFSACLKRGITPESEGRVVF